MEKKFEVWMKIILIINTIVLIGFGIYSIRIGSHFIVDSILSLFVFYILYFLRKKINLNAFHYFLFAILLIIHNLGAVSYGESTSFYGAFPFGVEYDYWVHSYFGFVASLILYKTFHYYKFYSPYFLMVGIIVIILGFSAFHELLEFAGAVTLGKGEGILFIGAGDLDEWDTQKDMLNNVIGGIIGLTFYGIWNFVKKNRVNVMETG